MDQDVFNVIFQDNVLYLSIKYNHQAYYKNLSIDNINERFNTEYKDQKDLDEDIVILHLAGRNKPWKCKAVNYYEEWLSYYNKLGRDERELQNKNYEIKKRLYIKKYEGDKDVVVCIGNVEVLRRHIESGIAQYKLFKRYSIKKSYTL